ncbi:hypothetical protein CHELA20_40312 [Hyphomicrobiales bacterium]|nr:hypothetical protein CHELA20_40312 [Hyphomicrobiales bacterium]CAH1688143.1 hypothetical protein CHELA41_40169 [Hyphomicrobiales bacterium]
MTRRDNHILILIDAQSSSCLSRYSEPFLIGNEPKKTIEPPVRIAFSPCCELVLHFADYQRSSPRVVR